MIRPLNTNVLIERKAIEEKTPGGIIIPDVDKKEKPAEGKVLAIGSLVEQTDDLKIGDIVLFGKYAGTEVERDGKTFLMVPECDLMGVVE